MKRKIWKLYDTVAYWTVPPGFRQLIGKFISSVLSKGEGVNATSEMSYLAQRNSEFKDRHKGERCFILATGPSVKEQDLAALQGELCIAVSHFFLHKDIRLIAPRYHVIAPYHPPFDFQSLTKLFENLRNKYSEEIIYFFGYRPYQYSIYDFLKLNPSYNMSKQYFIDYTDSKELDDSNYMIPYVWDISKSPFQIRTVVYTAIQMAIYMGCTEIYLLGCDHDYLQDIGRVTNHHFYREEDGQSDVEVLTSFSAERWFEEYYFRWKQYRLMKEYSESIGCKIFNATRGGLLDVFPR